MIAYQPEQTIIAPMRLYVINYCGNYDPALALALYAQGVALQER